MYMLTTGPAEAAAKKEVNLVGSLQHKSAVGT
jgi:hypothetical protein